GGRAGRRLVTGWALPGMRRQPSRREQLARARSPAKTEIHAVLVRRLVHRPPVSDLFGVKGRRWLAELDLPLEESETIDACLRHIEFLDLRDRDGRAPDRLRGSPIGCDQAADERSRGQRD